MANDIIRLKTDQEFYKAMSKKGIERAKFFNINQTVSSIVHVFNSLQSE